MFCHQMTFFKKVWPTREFKILLAILFIILLSYVIGTKTKQIPSFVKFTPQLVLFVFPDYMENSDYLLKGVAKLVRENDIVWHMTSVSECNHICLKKWLKWCLESKQFKSKRYKKMEKQLGKKEACKVYREEKEKCGDWCDERAGRLEAGEYKKECTVGWKTCHEMVTSGRAVGIFSKSQVGFIFGTMCLLLLPNNYQS